jgi:hypothetical protein
MRPASGKSKTEPGAPAMIDLDPQASHPRRQRIVGAYARQERQS